MKRLITGLMMIMLLLSIVACDTTATESEVGKEPPPMTAEEGKGLPVESWQISENWTYSQEAIWGDVMVGLEIERQQGEIVKQCIATYDLRSRKKDRVLDLSADRILYEAPAIHGSRVVWASVDRDEAEQQRSLKRAPMPNWDVFLLDLETDEVQQLTTEEHAQVYPRIYGDTVVWLDARYVEGYHNPQRYDVYAYNLKTKIEKRLTSAPTAEGRDLSISGSLVVWTDDRHADPPMNIHAENERGFNNEIYAYDLSTNQEKRITNYPGNDRYPVIDGTNIVWLRQLYQDYIKADVFVYNAETGQETQVSHSSYADFHPSIHENRIVWADARVSNGNTSGDTIINGRQGQTDIYLYDLETQQEMQLTSTEPGEVLRNPVIHGDSVVYVWVSMIKSIVYGMNLDYK